jgi:hypothetical protein
MRLHVLALSTLLVVGAAAARDSEGRLDVILAPNNAQPAIVAPGGQFEAVLAANAPLRIESAQGVFALESSGARPWRGAWRVDALVPTDAPPGAYALVAVGANGPDPVYRAVFVQAQPAETYRVAHIANLRVGDPEGSDSRLFRVTASLNASAPDLILVTGDLTAGGAAEQFRLALEVLNDCAAPTLVAPGAADDREGLAETYLGRYPAAIAYGLDGYLLCPPGARPGSGADGRLHVERRRIRSARWSLGVAARSAWDDPRTNLTLLIDDPLDYVAGGDAGPGQAPRTWGGAHILTARPGRATVRWFTVGPRGIEDDAEVGASAP